jgi:hypothetical protein
MPYAVRHFSYLYNNFHFSAMFQRDYILRIIEMAAKTIAAILGLIKKGDTEKASEELTNLYYDLLKEDAAFFKQIPAEKLTEKLLQEHNYTNGHLEILAELFNAEAELCLSKNDVAGTKVFSDKALRLFTFIDGQYKTYSQERIDKMDKLRKYISG